MAPLVARLVAGGAPQKCLLQRRSVLCAAATKKKGGSSGGKTAGKGFGAQTAPAPTKGPARGIPIQLLDDLPVINVDPDTGIDEETRDQCLFYMNKTEELCGRLPKALDAAWVRVVNERLDDCEHRPVAVGSAGESQVHFLEVTHDDATNPALLRQAWERVQPDAIAMDVQPIHIKSLGRIAKLVPEDLMTKILTTPLTSLSGALDHLDDFDRLKWHHALLSAVSANATSLTVDASALVNAFAGRDLFLAEGLAACTLAAGKKGVLVHGMDVEDDALIQALDDDSYWGEDDVAAYRRRLLEAADPQLRQAVNTWWQGIPSGTSSTIPRQRFVLTRLEQALPRQQREAVAAADAAARAAHKSEKARESLVLRARQAEHMAGVLRQVASGRLGGRRCSRVLAVVGAGGAGRVRQALQGGGSSG